jgi:hypothetical protein
MWWLEPVTHKIISMLSLKPPTSDAQGNTRHPDTAHIIDTMRQSMTPSFGLKNKIRAIRQWDKNDTRIKKIHSRMARDCVRGGLMLDWQGPSNERISKIWKAYRDRLHLNRIDKLKSDARQFVVQGNLALQWVFDRDARNVSACLSMPVDTLVPNTLTTGQIADAKNAYSQVDFLSGKATATFALWQLTLIRLDPDNYDDAGCLGRPYLDAIEKSLQQLDMTEEDLVVRRRTRAPQKNLFALEGAEKTDLEKFDEELETKRHDVSADYVTNRKAAVHSVGGDANLDQIGDVAHLLNTGFAAAPGPKSLFGYTEETSRDVLEDLKKDYFEEIDELQDTLASAYEQGFALELMLHGIDPAAHEYTVKFTERRTESRNQKADLALKMQAMGASFHTVFKTAGTDPIAEQKLIDDERKRGVDQHKDDDPHGETDSNVGKKPSVTITENNAPKGESATNIKNKS